jgi:hypothetical protein
MIRQVTALLLLLIAPCARGDEAAAPNWDGIADIDHRFFMKNPALPWSKDPFRRKPASVGPEVTAQKPTLDGISIGGDKSIAIINGHPVSVGDKIDGRKVIEIGATFVVLEKKSSLIQLTLPNNPTPASNAASAIAPKGI